MSTRVPYLTARLQGFGTTIFAEVTRAAIEHDAVNLGQGFPDFDGLDFVREAAIEALRAGHNQYARSFGVPALNRAIAAHQKRFYDIDCDPDSEVTVYSGATEAIFAALQALCDVGDEVVMFEPYYDSYLASICMAGAAPRVQTLRAVEGEDGPTFRFDADALERVVSGKTRAILLNTPHNPSGRVFSREELAQIAAIARKNDLIVISDEVYEHLVYEGQHVPIATLPGMRERTVTISSAGKTFSLTGWKVGWTVAPPPLTRALRSAHQFITFATATPLQHAIAVALEQADERYYDELVAAYRARRDKLCAGLSEVGFAPARPEGTYFVCADIRPLGFESDVALCRVLPERAGVAAIPTSAFCRNKAEGEHLVRFAFCKSEALLDEGIRRLRDNIETLRA
ncbi:MAG: aminotransferase class I/II-fold pyridoxal phosphate-dependent enzyme [Myxococcales bacterium]|nr:aminotransferase class I/II-fold pyridoxal phosphate-dependent enzyme [Myxococcales bacterium]